MFECRWTYAVERWFDGEHPEPETVERHVQSCAACAEQWAALRALRSGAHAAASRQEIRDPQLQAFLSGIREGIEAPRRSYRGLWALASVAAAALIVAAAVVVIFSGGPGKVDATVVESVSSDIKGATVESYSSKNGVTTVWLKAPAAKDDIL